MPRPKALRASTVFGSSPVCVVTPQHPPNPDLSDLFGRDRLHAAAHRLLHLTHSLFSLHILQAHRSKT
eukprot:scaffold2740_cov130-Isochrysis_galbana.AAC.8